MNHNESNSAQFLALFNELDKYIEEMLHIDVYLPYNDKLKLMSEGNFPVSNFVKRYYHELKYFGELRNHITHGLRMDGKMFSSPTDYAIEELRKFKNAIKTPKTWSQIRKRPIITCKPSDSIENIIHLMKEHTMSFIPVIADYQHYIGTITYQNLNEYLIEKKSLQGCAADISFTSNKVVFVSAQMNLYQIEDLFKNSNSIHKLIETVYITNKWTTTEQIIGYILPQDIIKIQDIFFE